MSKQGNIETNNICATEDIFEQFAAQEYESGDFITLSELVPSSYTSNEVMDTIIMELPNGGTQDPSVMDMDNITFDADDQQLNVQEINSFESVDSVASSVMDNVSFANDDQQVGAQEIHSELPNKTYVVYNSSETNVEPPKKAANKRGRKKKSDVTAQKNTAPQDNSDLNYDMVIGEDDFLDPAPPTPTRRGVRSLRTSVVKAHTPKVSPKPTSPKQVAPPKKPRGRPPKIGQPELTTSTVETKRKYGRKRKSDSDTSPLFTSTIETKQNNEQKDDPNMHGIVLNNDNGNCDITSSSNVDMKSDEFLDNVVKEVIVTNEETKVVDNNVNDAPDMCSEIVGEVEIMTSGNDDIDNIPLGQLSKVINKPFPMAPTNDYAYNKSIAEKSDAKQFCTKKVLKNVKKGRPKKKAMNVEDDGMDDVCLSKLKKSFNEPVKENETIVNEQHPDITTTVQENVEMDTATSSTVQENVEIDTATPAIDSQVDVSGETSKRPVRRRAKKILHYEQDSEHSDEDPFANVELSDDEPSSGKKGGRYHSDDEYIPGMENDEKPDKLSDSEAEDDFEFIRKQKKRKLSKSPKKKIIEETVSAKADELDDDIEGCIETSVIKLTEGEQSSWGTTKEFENFLANKVGSDVFIKKSKSSKSQIAPLEIPVLDPNEPKTKNVETSSQTNVVHTKNSFAQTETQNDLSMKEQVKLTPVQSEKACEFLSNIVRTTAELGQLMTQKSEDFIEKKINTTHVTDTLKMDYCVKKSFLLFKLAKHNLIQMEEDLARQYEDFLSSQKLIQYREKKKVIEPKVKNESDSDCEIVEILSDAKKPSKKKEEKSSFNPKTVFLNKELSIKIAKKQTPSVSTETKTSAKNMNIKGRHTVWINDSIMVKKVKPNQSFLAQDSRNKKPPDSQFITLKMVNDFFKSYYRQKVLSTCAPFVECNWFTSNKSYCCYYSTEIVPATSSKCTLIANNTPIVGIPDSSTRIKIPKPLLTLCVIVLKKLINLNNKLDVRKVLNQSDSGDSIYCINNTDCSELCIPNSINYNDKNIDDVISSKDLKNVNAESQINNKQVKSLSILCLQVLQKHIYWQTDPSCNNGDTLENFVCEDRIYEEKINTVYNVSQKFNSNVKSLSTLCLQELQCTIPYESTNTKVALSDAIFDCYNDSIDDGSKDLCYVENYNNYEEIDCNQTENIYLNNVNSLKTICHRKIIELIFNYPENFDTHLEPTIINSYTLRPVNESRNEEVKSLFSLCTRYLQNTLYPHNKQQTRVNNFRTHYEPTIINSYTLRPVNESRNEEVKSLFSLCTRYLQNIQHHYSKEKIKVRNIPSYTPKTLSSLALKSLRKKMMHEPNSIKQKRKKKPQVQTLSRLCFKLISSILYKEELCILNKKKNISHHKHSTVHPLKKLCLEKVTNFMGLPYVNADLERNSNGLSITINEINTVSEEFFNNEYDSYDEDGAYDNTDFGVENDEESHCEIENNYDDWENDENIPNEGTEWATHIQMGDLRTCGDARKSIENVNNTSHEEAVSINPLEPSILSNIKQEVCEDAHYMPNVMTIIKNEPDLDEAHLNDTEPLHRITKTEHSFLESTENIKPVLLNSYDVNTFEKFVSSNKLMYSMADGGSQDEEEGYGQGFPRFRRQYEPDLDGDEDNFDNLGLLVPQSVEQAKDRLMNSSSDEEGKSKKNDKRKNLKKRGRPKKVNKEIVPIKSKNGDDVATLTKKMKERLRQEDNEENESEEDEIPLILRKDKSKKISNTNKEIDKVETSNQNNKVEKDKDSQATSYEIQCNNIDSTENVETIEERNVRRSLRKKLHLRSDEVSNEDSSSINTGVSEDVENSHCEESKEQENPKLKQDNSNLDLRRSLRKNKVDKEDPKSETLSDKCDKSTLNSNDAIQSGFIIDAAAAESSQIEEQNNEHSEPESYTDPVDMDEPIELLECEPTLPVLDSQADTKRKTKVKKTQKGIDDTSASDKDKSKEIVIRNGWECYPVDRSDAKLYNYASVSLEKLPESFVETYFKYINLDKDKDEDDIEIERLTNLQSLNREKVKSKEVTRRSKTKKTSSSDPSEAVTNIKLELEAENADELTASEDEIDNTDEMVPPVQENDAENYLAKSLLMGDNDSETEEAKGSKTPEESKEKRRPGPKSKTKLKTPISNVKKEDGDILLTADRMMNSELALLHAPVTSLTDQMIKEDKDFVKKNKQHKNKTSSKSHTTTVHIRKDDDSSSEEEKQWVTTKEKLLRRLEKKQENHIDDAKRAKIVSEYIEKRREDGPVSQSVLRRPRRGRSRRDRRKLLERRKQMKVLSRELCGEDGSSSKRYSHSYGKGRRNIRKVIDKKSLARNTVLANIEEFERKRRLSMREAQLKETLGFEEDVNVVVINDELCLEYDFDNNQPAVTVHPFFTKVMKAHQYEGVKFMWDACFETVETVQNGGTGGGCILAHCMGLGKTLQVLALLHTVLTHPGVAMQRVLVCCPLSTVLNWVDEIHKWIGPVTNQIKVFELSKLKKTYERAYQLEDWYSGGGIFIIGYELFRSLSTLDPVLDDVRPTIVNKIRTALLDPGPDIIICDEGHLLKNDMSVLAVAMSRVVTKRRIVLTGTPMQNNLREYYCMVNFIKPNLLGTYSEYSNRFENPIMNGQHRDSMEEDIKLMKQRTHILHKVLEGCLQRQEASVLYPYLPKKYEYTVFISLTPCQWDLYKHYISQTRGMCKGNKHNILKDFHVLQKIWSHPQVLHHFQTKGRDDEKLKAEKIEDELLRDDLTASEDIKPTPTDVWWLQYLDGGTMLDDLDSSNKFLVVFRLLDECVALGDKVLIFSTSLYALDALEYFLRRINGWSLGHDYYRLDGSVPAEVRQKWCREFNDESNTHTKLFLISTRAGCLGLNMTAANRVIILDTSWNPAHDIQSIFRVYRFGQKKDCFIYRLVALGTMEQKMYERSVTKQAVACRVVDEQQIDRHYNMAELSELYNYDEEGLSVDAGLAAGVRDAALLRVAAALQGRAGALHAVREHDSLLRDTDARLPEHERAAAWQQFQQEHAGNEEQTLVKIPKKVKLKINETKEAPPTNPTESIADSKPSRKRGRPRKFSPDRSEPSTSKPTFSITQEIIVDKIRELLVQHNAVQATQADIARMIGDVRQYIVDPTSDIGSNPLVKEIADVLLRQNMPPLTDCIESKNTDEPEMILGDSDTRNQDDNVQTLSDSEATLSETEFEEKKRKKSKTDDDYVPPLYYKMDENFVSGKSKGRGRPRKNFEKTPPQKTRTTPRNKDATVNVQTDDYSELAGVHTIDDGINEDTIDISDDDTIVQKPAPNSRKTTQKATKTPEVTKKPPATANELPSDILLPAKTAVEAIPLPKSLLTDKKFIKIVAHMYVSSSPILDEDAATRAAEYSTAKALRELNETGDKIVSGNLHEIALKVYGPEALKRLNLREDFETKSKSYEVTASYNDNSSSSQSSGSKKKPVILKKKTQKPSKTQEEAPSNVAESNTTQIIREQEIPEPMVAQRPLKKVVITPMSNNSFDFKVTSGPSNNNSEVYQVPKSSPCIVPTAVREEIIPVSAPSTERVVPVGMFTGAGTIAVPSSREESILPDDDDVMVIPLDPPLSAGLSKQLDDLLIPRQQDTVLQPQQFLISSGPPSSVGTTLAYSTSTEPTANPAPANSTLANPHLVSMLANPSPAIPTPANPTPANPAQPNPALANSIVPIMVTDPPVAKTKPRPLSKSLPKDANNKTQSSKVLPQLPPTAKGKRTYLIKTADLEAALSKYPEGQGPTIHLDSGKVMVPVQFIKQSKNQGEGGNLVITKVPTSNQNIVVPLPASTKQAKPATPVVYDSICLDSDEEDATPPPPKKPEPIVGPSRLDLSQLKKAEPKPKDTEQPEIKATPTPAKTDKTKTLSDLKLGFDKDKKKITFIPSNPAAKKPETPKKDTKAESIRPNSMVFDDGASIEFVSLFDNITPTTPAKSTPPPKPTPTSKPTPPAKTTPTSKPTTPAKSTPPAKSILPKSATPAKSTTPAKPTPSAKSTVPAKSTPPAKSIPVTDKRVSEKPKTDTPKNQPKPKSKQTAPQTDLGMIDLTHFDVEPKKNTSTKGKSISGTSKDIFITNAGKLSTDKTKILNKEIDLTGGDVTKVINIKPSTSSASSSVKRTKKPEISTPVKKPKLETKSKPSSALKSLMDLTFDDIDDIVELE